MMQTDATTALWFLPFVLPIAVWVSWSDMKYMLIPNKAVIALTAVFFVVGLIALPLDVWAWRWVHLGVVLAFGFLMNMIRWLGAGDAKYAAAMAPFFAIEDLGLVLTIYVAASVGSFICHRLVRLVPSVRAVAPDWVSWKRRDFPMGLALSGVLVIYLLLAVWWSAVI